MLKRKIEQQLLTWKQTPNHKPLIIKGCRQCGKTFSVRKFCEEIRITPLFSEILSQSMTLS